ncbi:MAG: DUF5666 domain-containing protein [Janthinobacterium lividum]
MSEDLRVDADREHPTDDADPDRTAVRPGLADDLLEPVPYADDDLLQDEEFMAPGGPRPSRVTRVLLALLILGVGVLLGVQLGLAGGSAPARRSAPPAGTATAGGSVAARSTLGSSTPAGSGEVSSLGAHTLVLSDQGTSQRVTFTDDTTVTETLGHGALAVGDAVTVFGSKAADGSVNATSIVVR